MASRLERDGYLIWQAACQVAQDVARGLAHLHDNDVVHRDVRPANLWITDGNRAKVMEFGAARDAYAHLDGETAELTDSDTVLGDFDYMAPEQAQDPRRANAQSDIYALGCTLYHCLSSRMPFEVSNPVKKMLQHATQMPTPMVELVDGIPHQLDETLFGMLAKNPEDRFQTMDDVVRVLDPFVPMESDSEPVVVQSVSPQYLAWASVQQPAEPVRISDESVGITPELTNFLDWMASKEARRKK